MQAYAWALQDHGGRILQSTTVTGLARRGGRVTAVETTRGTFDADVVVIAAGPQTGAFAEMLGVWLPLAPARVEMIATEPIPLMRVGGVAGNGLYGRQTLRGPVAQFRELIRYATDEPVLAPWGVITAFFRAKEPADAHVGFPAVLGLQEKHRHIRVVTHGHGPCRTQRRRNLVRPGDL